ncbi:unnamed protein product [Adineta ricciae]|uniref:ADP ribosyltransferase domain-containing protein n=1 Tax=Adineta ricciae TaxID=249248 RepID=A0A814C4W1_ADIRI|nr:unnamed protein product [Adineta ricciae]CAF1321530.1 unnamed protein product [Adineta ricciae]
MPMDEAKKKLLYDACSGNDYETFIGNWDISEIDTALDDQGNTALHIAASHDHADLVRFLLLCHASPTKRNNEEKTPEEMASDDEIKEMFKAEIRPSPTTEAENRFVGNPDELEPIEWLDSYNNAYRIAYENHEHMKRWITRVPLRKLLDELRNNYIQKMKFSTDGNLEKIIEFIDEAIKKNDLIKLITLYTNPIPFCSRLNEDLAKLGSDFRFVSTQLDSPDNEAPKDLGQYIFASLLVNHQAFRRFQKTAKTYRGMNVYEQDLKEYAENKIVITRSFLSTSKKRSVAEIYLGFEDSAKGPAVMCIYNVSNPRSSLHIQRYSRFPIEAEVLIVPFVAFKITSVKKEIVKRAGKDQTLTTIELVECEQNPK